LDVRGWRLDPDVFKRFLPSISLNKIFIQFDALLSSNLKFTVEGMGAGVKKNIHRGRKGTGNGGLGTKIKKRPELSSLVSVPCPLFPIPTVEATGTSS
jgi:hypothetical protein